MVAVVFNFQVGAALDNGRLHRTADGIIGYSVMSQPWDVACQIGSSHCLWLGNNKSTQTHPLCSSVVHDMTSTLMLLLMKATPFLLSQLLSTVREQNVKTVKSAMLLQRITNAYARVLSSTCADRSPGKRRRIRANGTSPTIRRSRRKRRETLAPKLDGSGVIRSSTSRSSELTFAFVDRTCS